ncbi:hypothetical protein FKM82_025249 [Ascaphus truei]
MTRGSVWGAVSSVVSIGRSAAPLQVLLRFDGVSSNAVVAPPPPRDHPGKGGGGCLSAVAAITSCPWSAGPRSSPISEAGLLLLH